MLRVIIGDGIVTALSMLTDGNIIKLTDAMRDLAKETSNIIVGLGVVADEGNKHIQKFGNKLQKIYQTTSICTCRAGGHKFKLRPVWLLGLN
jgi:hypothetical protein